MTTRTYTPRLSEIERRWFVVDANGQTLGRLASQVAQLLAGKHKPSFATHIDTGDHVIVINASRIAVGGDKLTTKVYARHSGYPGGFRQETLGDLLARRPEEVIRRAVKGMLPRNTLGVQQLRKLKVYAGSEHPHEAQQPEAMAPERATVSRAQRAGARYSTASETSPAAAVTAIAELAPTAEASAIPEASAVAELAPTAEASAAADHGSAAEPGLAAASAPAPDITEAAGGESAA